MANLDKCSLTLKDLNFHPWVFTSEQYGIPVMDIIAAYNKRCNIDSECDCESGCAEDQPAVETMSTQRVSVNALSDDQVRNSFDAMLKAMGAMERRIKELEAKLNG